MKNYRLRILSHLLNAVVFGVLFSLLWFSMRNDDYVSIMLVTTIIYCEVMWSKVDNQEK